jgi:hypothetical protein
VGVGASSFPLAAVRVRNRCFLLPVAGERGEPSSGGSPSKKNEETEEEQRESGGSSDFC